MNLAVYLSSGNIEVTSKLEGDDIHLSTSSGSIVVSKLRAHRISLSAPSFVGVSSLVEAEDGRISGGRIRAKMLNGRNMHLTGTSCTPPSSLDPNLLSAFDDDDGGAKIDVGSLYTSDTSPAFISTKRDRGGPFGCAVRVKNSHGGLNVDVASEGEGGSSGVVDMYGRREAVVELGGISGSCNLKVEGGSSDDLSARVHFDSVFKSGWSSVSAESGDVELTVDRKVHSSIRMLSSGAPLTAIHTSLLDGSDPLPTESLSPAHLGRIDIKTNAFKPAVKFGEEEGGGVEYVEGDVFNDTAEPDSRFEVQAGNMKRDVVGGGGGKVDIEGASNSALDAFGQQKKDNHDGEDGDLHVITVGTGGGGAVSLETLEWMETIKRRFGMGGR
ncbi:hypothetical protein TrRE_jg4550 [Triparma retinervis]|uniref:Adhesin domain-containing protein n=1 Tax=Triparma retinervis TaxID=2557542 RepID=A0A9W6ZE27_9STRA|nr:hypothetical protein TrRE_jg4550 [Triparma retinervis]